MLYVGRMRKEKGIFSLINLIKKDTDINLTIVGEEENSNVNTETYENIEFCQDY